jgi:hypothetical protein
MWRFTKNRYTVIFRLGCMNLGGFPGHFTADIFNQGYQWENPGGCTLVGEEGEEFAGFR